MLEMIAAVVLACVLFAVFYLLSRHVLSEMMRALDAMGKCFD